VKSRLLLFLLLAAPFAARAQYDTSIVGPNQVEISLYTGSGTALVIPSIINGGTVVSIGNGAFSYSSTLTSVTIPNTVTSIGSSAFYECNNMTSVDIPSSVTSIGYQAFFYCAHLSGVTIPSSVTSIGNQAFDGCVSLASIAMPTSNTFFSSINGVLFNGTATTLIQYPGGLTGAYIIPSSVTTIAPYSFSLDPVAGVTIPSSVTTIGNNAFDSCTSLTSVSIPPSVTSIGDQAFAQCTSVTSFNVSSQNFYYSSPGGILFNSTQTVLYQYPLAKSAGNYIIPSNVTDIGDNAFADCASLAGVTFPAGLTNIGNDAFAFCSGLETALFLGNAPTVGTTAFSFAASSFTVEYNPGTTGFSSPTWTDSSGDAYPAISLINQQSIAFPAIATQLYPSSPIGLTAAASSGLPVLFSIVSGPATIPQSSTILTVTGTGIVVVQASQSGNTDYAPATSIQQSFAVAESVPLSTWENTYSVTDLTATPEDDGVSNLLKYVYDIIPTTAVSATDRVALPSVGMDTTTDPGTEYLALTYRQYALATGITVHLQTSTDLQHWATVTPDVDHQTSVDPHTGDPIIEMGVIPVGSREFIRLNVTQP
jgi:hypothetical protein